MFKKLFFLFLGEPVGFLIFSCSNLFSFLYLLHFISCRFHLSLFSFLFILLCSCFCFFRFFYCWLHLLMSSSFFCCYRQCCGFERASFTLRCFLPYTSSCLYQGFHGVSSSVFKVAGLPTEIKNIDPTLLFVWITQCLGIIQVGITNVDKWLLKNT